VVTGLWVQQMTSSRKIKRNKEKRLKKEVKQKMNMFSRLPDECLACVAPFDKNDKEMVKTWTVVVKEAEKKVNLYCPDCWQTATKVVKEYYQEKEDDEQQN